MKKKGNILLVLLIVLCVALAAMFASICLFITIRNQKK